MLEVDQIPLESFKIGLFGSRNVGKTHLIRRLTQCKEDPQYIETQTVIQTTHKLQEKQQRLVFYDLPALKQSMIEEIAKKQKFNLVIFLFKDSTSFTELYQFLEAITKMTSQKQSPEIEQYWKDIKHVFLIYSNFEETSAVQTDQLFNILSDQVKNFNDQANVRTFLWRRQDQNADQIKNYIAVFNYQQFHKKQKQNNTFEVAQNNQIKDTNDQRNVDISCSSNNQDKQNGEDPSLPVKIVQEGHQAIDTNISTIKIDQNDGNSDNQIAMQHVKKVQSQLQVAGKKEPSKQQIITNFIEEINQENIQKSPTIQPIEAENKLQQFQVLQPFEFKPQNIIIVPQLQIQIKQPLQVQTGKTNLQEQLFQNRVSNQGQQLQIPKLQEQLTNNTAHKPIKQQTETNQNHQNQKQHHHNKDKHSQTAREQSKAGLDKSLKRDSEAIQDLFPEWRMTSKKDQSIDREVDQYWEEKKKNLGQSQASHSDQMKQEVIKQEYNLSNQVNQTDQAKPIVQKYKKQEKQEKQKKQEKKEKMKRPQSNISRALRTGKQKRERQPNHCSCEIM